MAIDLENGKITPLELEKNQVAKFLPLAVAPKVGEITLNVKDEMGKDPKRPFHQKRTLTASKGDKKLWEREILAPVNLPPRP